MDYKMLSSKKVFDGYIVDINHDMLLLPDGQKVKREIIVRGNAAAIVPVNEEGKLVLIRQYRHGSKSMALEIPAGMLNHNEKPIECAFRELEEETGYKAGRLFLLSEMYPAMGFCTEKISVYLALDLMPGTQNLDFDEIIEIETYGIDEAVAKIFSGEIVDGKTIAGILAAKEYMKLYLNS